MFYAISTVAFHRLSKPAFNSSSSPYPSLTIKIRQIWWCNICSSILLSQFLSSKPCCRFKKFRTYLSSLLVALINKFSVSWQPKTKVVQLIWQHHSFSPKMIFRSKRALNIRICFPQRRMLCLNNIDFLFNSCSKQHLCSRISSTLFSQQFISSLKFRNRIKYLEVDLSPLTTIAFRSHKSCKQSLRYQIKSLVSKKTTMNSLPRSSSSRDSLLSTQLWVCLSLSSSSSSSLQPSWRLFK